MNRSLCLFICIGFGSVAWAGPSVAPDGPADIRGEAELDAVIAQLREEGTRLAALDRLIHFGAMRIYQNPSMPVLTGDPARDALIQKAANAVAKQRDFETVAAALRSSSATLQFWGLWLIPDEPKEDAGRWNSLLPRVRELARDAAPHVRGRAQEDLGSRDGEEDFLEKCAESETCAENIMRLVCGWNGADLNRRLNPHLLRLLDHPDESVRTAALFFIGSNSHIAPMWQIAFVDRVFARVLELSHSHGAAERAAAVDALTDLRARDPEAVRKRMLELADDPSLDVRWRIPDALASQLDRADVQALLARLLRDESAIVRYFTILTLGPDKHIEQLRDLATGPDAKIAGWAAEQIKMRETKEPR